MTRKERFEKVLEYFQKTRPVAETELRYKDAYELIVAVILSAQCTDKRVNIITPALLDRFPTAENMASADPREVYELIKSCSYPNNKTKHLIGMAKTLTAEFKGIAPSDIKQLQRLPGVGRKSANVIAAVIYNKPTLAVDTHVFRVAARIGLTINARNPLQAERQLVKHIPEKLIPLAHHWLILHGRYTCMARKPRCYECGLVNMCRYKNKNLPAKTINKKNY
jgi:endonuclease-3